MILSPILPRIRDELQIAEALLGTLGTAYVAMLALFALIIGPISDKVGRRVVLLIGTGCMVAALALHVLAFDYYSLLFLRALAGASGGLLSGAAVAYVGDYFPYQQRGWANGWIMSGMAVGQILGIPLGTILAGEFGFRIPFLWFAVMMAGSFFLIWFRVPQPDVRRDNQPLSISRALNNYLDLLKNREIASACAVYCLMFLGILLFVFYLPTWLEDSVGLSTNDIAGMFLVGGIASVLTGPQAGKLSDRFGRKPLIITSCLGLAISMVLTTVIIQSLWMAYLVFFISMILVAMRISPLQALLTALVSADRRGTLMSLAVAVGQAGSVIGTAISGFLYTSLGFGSNTVLSGIAMVCMALLVAWALPEPALSRQADTREVTTP